MHLIGALEILTSNRILTTFYYSSCELTPLLGSLCISSNWNPTFLPVNYWSQMWCSTTPLPISVCLPFNTILSTFQYSEKTHTNTWNCSPNFGPRFAAFWESKSAGLGDGSRFRLPMPTEIEHMRRGQCIRYGSIGNKHYRISAGKVLSNWTEDNVTVKQDCDLCLSISGWFSISYIGVLQIILSFKKKWKDNNKIMIKYAVFNTVLKCNGSRQQYCSGW